jgi:hypothetical protein
MTRHHGRHLIGILSRKVIELASAVVVNHDYKAIAVYGFDLELPSHTG